ncbi:NUDIX domain-containing protein [Baekduia sp. Peel2402]|uniref:NUDIX domain-containing protein n=1 Tax=Baekduia sp. Peel2402 TaxID=3458296 RepID=UPI00403EA10A
MIEVTATKVVYENRWMRVREDETLLPDGSPGIYAVVEKPPAAVIVPFDDDDRSVWLVEQYRHPVGARFWEVPQGAWEDSPSAPAEELARGELAEETGLRAGRIEKLGRLYFAYGIANQPFDVWVARDLEQGEQALEVTEQGLICTKFPVDEVRTMVREGRIQDSATVAALSLALGAFAA